MGCCNIKDKPKKQNKVIAYTKFIFAKLISYVFMTFLFSMSIIHKKYKQIFKAYQIFDKDIKI